jgi:hypothetical protein
MDEDVRIPQLMTTPLKGGGKKVRFEPEIFLKNITKGPIIGG